MGVRVIVQAPDAVLRRVAQHVERFGRPLRKLRHRMLNEMVSAGGVGLAAPQVGLSLRFFVYDDRAGQRGAVVNPVLMPVESSGRIAELEGCLSVSEARDRRLTERWRAVVLMGKDEAGRAIELVAEGLLARIFQHEVDHLNGVLFVDRADRSEMAEPGPAGEEE